MCGDRNPSVVGRVGRRTIHRSFANGPGSVSEHTSGSEILRKDFYSPSVSRLALSAGRQQARDLGQPGLMSACGGQQLIG
jgi:hypothetical protein